ncbi:MAG: putative glycosyltransferase (TIGR04372 family) [Bacteriovoracaceae bacterium]|jgi:putative glycosyltransferase (TIGR04372 family)
MHILKKLELQIYKLISIPCIIFIRLISPIITIRFGLIDKSRIGGFYAAEFSLCQHQTKFFKKRTIDLFFFANSTPEDCNEFWINLWRRKINIFPFKYLGQYIFNYTKVFPNSRNYLCAPAEIAFDDGYIKSVIAATRNNISLSDQEKQAGEVKLIEMGVEVEKPIICFHNRDSAYLDKVSPNKNWSYHDFRDTSIKIYLPAAREFVKLGYQAIRVGSVVKERLENEQGIIDYSNSRLRSEFMDVYLGQRCDIFLASATGITSVPECFRRPLVLVNWTTISRFMPRIHNVIFLPMRFIKEDENRELSFREIVNAKYDLLCNDEEYKKLNLRIVPNSPEEIMNAALEMHQRINGTWKDQEGDSDRQDLVWSIIRPGMITQKNARISAQFLRDNQYLLT